jgi:hypothetical protein
LVAAATADLYHDDEDKLKAKILLLKTNCIGKAKKFVDKQSDETKGSWDLLTAVLSAKFPSDEEDDDIRAKDKLLLMKQTKGESNLRYTKRAKEIPGDLEISLDSLMAQNFFRPEYGPAAVFLKFHDGVQPIG